MEFSFLGLAMVGTLIPVGSAGALHVVGCRWRGDTLHLELPLDTAEEVRASPGPR
jgi:hypothetical protein